MSEKFPGVPAFKIGERKILPNGIEYTELIEDPDAAPLFDIDELARGAQILSQRPSHNFDRMIDAIGKRQEELYPSQNKPSWRFFLSTFSRLFTIFSRRSS